MENETCDTSSTAPARSAASSARGSPKPATTSSLIARGAHLEAIRDAASRCETPDEAVTLPVPAVDIRAEIEWRDDDVVMLDDEDAGHGGRARRAPRGRRR